MAAMDAFAGTGERIAGRSSPEARAVAHLDPKLWAIANRRLTIKAIAEFAHELLLLPHLEREEAGWGHYRLDAPDGRSRYRFRARRLRLESWMIDPESLVRLRDDKELAPDALSFISEFQRPLGIRGRDAADLPRRDRQHSLFGLLQAVGQAPHGEGTGRRGLPDHRDDDERGASLLRGQQRTARVQHGGLSRLCAGGGRAASHRVARGGSGTHGLHHRGGSRPRAADGGRARRHGHLRLLRTHHRTRFRSGAVFLHAGAPLAVVQPAVDELRARDRRPGGSSTWGIRRTSTSRSNRSARSSMPRRLPGGT